MFHRAAEAQDHVASVSVGEEGLLGEICCCAGWVVWKSDMRLRHLMGRHIREALSFESHPFGVGFWFMPSTFKDSLQNANCQGQWLWLMKFEFPL